MKVNQFNRHFLNQHNGEKLLLTLWVGALWAIGYIAVPTLFGTLEDRQLAGMLAGKMFTAVSYLGLFCAVILLISVFKRLEKVSASLEFWLLIIMLVLVAVGEFILQPQMAELKTIGLTEGSEAAQQFARLHGMASILYLLNSLLGLILVIFHASQIDDIVDTN